MVKFLTLTILAVALLFLMCGADFAPSPDPQISPRLESTIVTKPDSRTLPRTPTLDEQGPEDYDPNEYQDLLIPIESDLVSTASPQTAWSLAYRYIDAAVEGRLDWKGALLIVDQ